MVLQFDSVEKSGRVESNLRDCNQPSEWNIACSALETMVLACACNGVDIESNNFTEAMQSVLDVFVNNFGED